MKNPSLETILTRRSVRNFTGEPVAPEDLNLILRAAMAAPSAVNVQPWSFLVVTERQILDNLCDLLPYAKMLSTAGAAVVVCGLPEKDTQFAKDFWMVDCAAATENILLAAHALGYGAVWTAVYPELPRMEAVREILGIPGNVIPLNVIPLGVPSGINSSPVDKYKEENIHRERWNKAK